MKLNILHSGYGKGWTVQGLIPGAGGKKICHFLRHFHSGSKKILKRLHIKMYVTGILP